MKTKTWKEFTEQLTEVELLLIIADHRQFKKDGFIGVCFLRGKAEEWCDNINNQGYVVLAMNDLAYYAYEHFANEYFKLANIEV